nr:class I SAM-dependent methyltransferase [Candidatus Gracilibacteria bacterium]
MQEHDFYNTSAKKRKKFYDDNGHKIIIHGVKGNQSFYKMVDLFIRISDSIIELGTGLGIVPKTIGYIGKDMISMDFSEEMLNIAKENCKEYKNITFKKGNINNIPYGDNLFDLVIKRLAPDNLKEISRILIPNGIFINFTNGEYDAIELKKLFNLPPHESINEFRTKLIDSNFDILYEGEFTFLEEYKDIDTLVKMLEIAPIIEDFYLNKEKYILVLEKLFKDNKSFFLTRHKYLTNARKKTI